MKDHDGCKRGFYRSSKAWYSGAICSELSVHLGMYHEDGGTTGEMTVKWVRLGSDKKLVPQLCAFDDSWSALSMFADVLEVMGEADDENITEQQFVDILLGCGFDDMTQYTDPDKDSARGRQLEVIKGIERDLESARETLRTMAST